MSGVRKTEKKRSQKVERSPIFLNAYYFKIGLFHGTSYILEL
jgi:hypothetical protein